MCLINKLIEDDDSMEMKEKEFRLLVIMFHNDSFFYLNKKDLLEKMTRILGQINSLNNICSKNKIYKYCDILDYILANNKDLQSSDIIKTIATNDDVKKIAKRFQLSLAA